MHSLLAKFWWGDNEGDKKIHWLAWDRLCKPKSEGGMGFRNLIYFNRALLAKQGWRILSRPEALVTRLLRAKYFPQSNFMQASLGSDPSFVWRSLLVGRDEVLKRGMRYRVGDGTKIGIWTDPWLPLPYHFKPYSPPMEGTEDWRVCDLIDSEYMDWIEPVIYDLFSKEEAKVILRIPLSMRRVQDKLFWHYDKHGVYQVKSGYHIARITDQTVGCASSSGTVGPGSGGCWKKIWQANVPPKVRSFVWRLCREVIPTRAALSRRLFIPDVRCIFCGNEVETELHLFRDCPVVQSFWKHNPLHLIRYSYPGSTLAVWVFLVMDNLSMQQLEGFFMALWTVWTESNNMIWRGGSCNPSNMSVWAMQLLEEYKKVHTKPSVKIN
ncbi:hypothetical protein ACLB2K_045339 [Fragaria x ananassa]